MRHQKTKNGKLITVFLAVLAGVTLVIFGFLFLDFGGMISKVAGNSSGGSVTTDLVQGTLETTDQGQVSSEIAEHQSLMNSYKTQLDASVLLLVDEKNPIPDGYDPTLVEVYENPNLRLEQEAASHLKDFLTSAKQAGYTPFVSAAYRTEKEQTDTYNASVQSYMNAGYPVEKAREMAAMDVGTVGCSEHQLGLAVDLKANDMMNTGDSTKTFAEYLSETIASYGFVLSYPAGKETQTGRTASSVHYRYVGTEAAKVMSERNLTLGEYRDYLQTQIDYQKQCIDSLQKK